MASIDNFTRAIETNLQIYNKEVNEGVKKATREAMHQMVQDTKKQTYKNNGTTFSKNIASRKEKETAREFKMLWYVKSPYHGLTHLLEDGHAMPQGGRSVAYNFVKKARDKAEEAFEKKLEDVLK